MQMESTASEALMRRWFDEVWNQGKLESIDQLLAEDCCVRGLDADDICSPAAYREFRIRMDKLFSNIQTEVEQIVANGNQVSGIATVNATHLASDTPVAFQTAFFCVLRDGKIAEAWNVTDFLSALTQSQMLPKSAWVDGLQGKQFK